MTFAKNVLMDFNVQRWIDSGANVEQCQQLYRQLRRSLQQLYRQLRKSLQQLYRQLRKSLAQGSRWTTLWDWTNKSHAKTTVFHFVSCKESSSTLVSDYPKLIWKINHWNETFFCCCVVWNCAYYFLLNLIKMSVIPNGKFNFSNRLCMK